MREGHDFSKALIIAPPSVLGTSWMLRFKHAATGRASGWMRIRGRRRRLALDRGFVLSDHADWPALVTTIFETGAERILVTHGSSEILARYLRERGLPAEALDLERWGEQEEEGGNALPGCSFVSTKPTRPTKNSPHSSTISAKPPPVTAPGRSPI